MRDASRSLSDFGISEVWHFTRLSRFSGGPCFAEFPTLLPETVESLLHGAVLEWPLFQPLRVRENMKQDCDMDKSTIIARLREYEAELKAAGVEHLLLHGSYARATAIHEGSDVDVIADFNRNRKLSLIGRVHLENRLTDILGVKADLCDRKMLGSEVLERVERESVLVF